MTHPRLKKWSSPNEPQPGLYMPAELEAWLMPWQWTGITPGGNFTIVKLWDG